MNWREGRLGEHLALDPVREALERNAALMFGPSTAQPRPEET